VIPDDDVVAHKASEAPNPYTVTKWREACLTTRRAMDMIDDYCRLLLEMAGDEITPLEMIAILRLPRDQNKKVSDDLRHCRKKLKSIIYEEGTDIDALFEP